MRLSLKIGLITAAVAGLIAVGISLNHSFWEGKAWRSELRSHASTMAEMLNLSVQESLLHNDFSALDYYLSQFNYRKDLAYVVVYDNVATPLASTSGQPAREAIALYQTNPRQHKRDIHSHIVTGKKIYEMLVPVMVDGQTWGMLQAGFFEDAILSVYHRTNLFNYLILFLGLAICLGAGWGVGRYLGVPIEALTEGADQLVKNNFNYRIGLKRSDELGKLVKAFNHMAGTISRDIIELESKNRELYKAQERQMWLSRIAEQVGDGVAVADLEGMITFANQSWAQMHGFSDAGKLLGKHLSIFHSHSQLEKEVLPFNQVVMEKGFNYGLIGHIKKDRTVFYAEMTSTLLRTPEGTPVGLIGVARDITEQKKIQDDLRRERDLVKSIFASTPDAIIITDLAGNFIDGNEKVLELFGYESLAEMQGKNFSHFISQDDRAFALHSFQKTIDYGQVNDLQLMVMNTKNEEFPLEYSTRLMKNAEGRPIYIVSIGRNISMRKKAEIALMSSEERFRKMAESINEGMVIIEKGKVVFANNRACEIYGCLTDELHRFNSVAIAAPEEKEWVKKIVDEAKTSGNLPKDIEFWIVRPDGERRFIHYNYYVNERNGEKVGYFIVFSDITERKLSEEAIKESELRLRSLSDNLPSGLVYQIDSGPDGRERRFTHISAGVGKLHGLRTDQVLADASLFYGQVVKEDKDLVTKLEEEAAENIAPFNVEVRIKLPSGELRWRQFSSAPRRMPNGHLVWDGIEIDITERKLAEQALKELTDRFEYALGATKTGFDIIDQDYSIIYIDPFWKKVYGEPGDKKCYHYFMDRSEPCAKCGIRAAIAEKRKVVEEQYLKKENRWVEVHTIPFQGANGKWMVAEFNIDITERKKSLEALRQSEEKYRELADTLPQTVFEIDEKGILLYVNSTGIQQFGYQADELGDGVNLSQMLMAEDRDRAMANIKRRLEGGEPENQEYRGIRKDGTVFPINIYSHTVVKDNRVTGLRGVIIDISEQKKAENAIRESETRYRTLFDQASDGIMFMPSDGLTVLVNQSFARMHGYDSPQDMADIDLGKLDAPSSAKLAPERLKRLMDGEKLRFEVEHYHRDGHIFPLRVSVSTVNIGGRLYFLGFHQDITEQRKAESAIKESEAKFRSLAETSPAAIFAYRNKFIYANPACTLLTGYPVSEMLEMNFWEVVHPDHREIVKQRGEARQRGESVPAHYEFKLLRKDGQERWIDFAGTLVDFEGQPAGMGMAIDITERKAMEEILEASEAQYRATLDSFADAIHVVDRDLNIILANETFKKWCRDLNLSDNPIGKNVFEICPFLNNDVRQEYERVFNTCLPLTTQEQNAVAAALIITETRKIPIMENGLATKIITVIRDITKEKEVAYKLAESELKYQQVLEGVAEGIYRTSPEGKILLANQAIVKMLGYSSMEELMARNIEKEGYSDPRYHREFVREMNGKGQVKDWVSEWKRKDGSILVVRENAHVVKDNTGKIIYYEGTVEDITEQRKAEQKLLETERKYYQIFEDIVEGIYRSTPDGKLLLANPALVKMLGYNNFEEMSRIDLNKAGYMDRYTRQRFKEQMERDGQVLGFEARWRRSDGRTLIISENARAVKDKAGNTLFYEGTVEDITEKQLAEEALLNEKNKLSDLFRVSLQVARATDIQQKLDLTMDGIAGTGLFARAVLVLKGENGQNTHISHFGMSEKEVGAILKAQPKDPVKMQKIFSNKFRYSNSYYVPHDAEDIAFSIKLTNKKYKVKGDWHPDDVLIVPLIVKDKHIGYLTVDEPADGKVPNLETVRLLELFTYQAAVAIDNLRLYNDLERSYYSTLKAFVAAMDAKDPYTKGHSENVRYHALRIARRLGLPEDQVRLIDFSSLLHDIGKLAIRDEILSKPSLLSDHEYQEVKLHPVIGSQLVSEVESLNLVAPIIHSHHEHFDGTGYPLGIKGEDIPLESRIIAVADAFEAMTSDRPYRKAFDYKVAIKRLKEAAGSQFDAEIVKIFVKLHRESHD